MNETELKNLNKMSDRKNLIKNAEKRIVGIKGEQRNLDVNKGELEPLLLGYVQRKTTVSFIERWARFKNMQRF